MPKWVRVSVPDELLPSAIRSIMTYGPTAVMPASWRDPDDIKPGAARTAREVRGHRAYDPLRWARRRHGDASVITELHIHAADRLRRAYDVARLGGLPGAVWAGGATLTHANGYGPCSGPTAPAMAMSRACREFDRSWGIMTGEEKVLLTFIVLENVSVTAWTRHRQYLGERTTPQAETRKLVVALDKLVAHYDSEIREDMALGRVEV